MSSPLDRILAIPDQYDRQTALVRYAKSVGADPLASHKDGECQEEMLVLLIYDAELIQKERQQRDLKIVAIGLFVLAGMIAVIGTVPQVFTAMFPEEETQTGQGKTLQAFDKNGKPVMEDNKPVLYKLMDGVYNEKDEAKGLKYEYTYQTGTLISKKTIDKNGKIIAVEKY